MSSAVYSQQTRYDKQTKPRDDVSLKSDTVCGMNLNETGKSLEIKRPILTLVPECLLEVLSQQWIVDLLDAVLGWVGRIVVVVVKILFLEARTVQDVGQDERWTVEGRAGDPRDRIVLRTGHTHAVQTVARFLLQH